VKALRYLPGIRDELHRLPPAARRSVKAALEGLARDEDNLDVRRLAGKFRHPLERLKVGAWRTVFYRDGGSLFILRVFPRQDGYDWLSEWEA
jgi:mRNA-degrading endonuclease RelE of RelBE toxin-antitoxin system